MYDNLGMIMAFVIPLGGLALLVFAIAAIIEGRSSNSKASMIKHIYIYLASLVTLTLVVASGMFLVRQGLSEWVFTKADSASERQNTPPPILYLSETTKPQTDVAPTAGQLTCTTNGCTITEFQRVQIANWESSYQAWRTVFINPSSQKTRDAVAALSFLIVSLPLFILHFRILQKEAKTSQEPRTLIRPAYFYYVSMASLLMMVIAGGFLINLALKTWVFPAAGKADEVNVAYQATPFAIPDTDKTAVQSLITCGEKCHIAESTIASAEQWVLDYAAYQKQPIKQSNNTQRQAADTIPFVLAGIPLFWYHWYVTRKESSKDQKGPSQPTV